MGSILAAGFAPAFIGASVLMPVRQIALAAPLEPVIAPFSLDEMAAFDALIACFDDTLCLSRKCAEYATAVERPRFWPREVQPGTNEWLREAIAVAA